MLDLGHLLLALQVNNVLAGFDYLGLHFRAWDLSSKSTNKDLDSWFWSNPVLGNLMWPKLAKTSVAACTHLHICSTISLHF